MQDIKDLRNLTRLLGKCGITSLQNYQIDFGSWGRPAGTPFTTYGLGLKTAVEYLMKKYDYASIYKQTNAERIINMNMIEQIKTTRRAMYMLGKLGVRSAGNAASLRESKQYVDRLRRSATSRATNC